MSSDLSLSGVSSGYDWQSLLDQLETVETNRLTPINNQITSCNNKLTAWQSFGSYLSILQSAADSLNSTSALDIFSASVTSSSSVGASSLLSASASSTASSGSYDVVITNKAQAEKLASSSFSSLTEAMNISGTILVNGKAVEIETTDTLQNIMSKINNLNTGSDATGVSAGIIQDSPTSYRLMLTSGTTGAAGISLLNGSASDTLSTLGFNGTGTVIKNRVSGAAESDALSSSSTSVETLLGIEDQDLSGTVTINGKTVTIDLTDSLDTIKDNMVAAGISAEVVSETSDSETSYRLKVEGMTNWTDENNVLQALGFVEGNREDEIGVTGDNANSTDGSTPITSDTKIVDIYGYTGYSAGDKITISGTSHDGTAVTTTEFAIDDTKTIGDLLSQVESLFGDVTAKITSDGKIQVIDNATGTSNLSVNLETSLVDPNGGLLDFGSFGEAGTVRKSVLQEGEDAAFTVDGISMTSTSNTISTAIPGVTLNLLGEDSDTTLTVNVDRDVTGIEDKINAMLSAYNSVISFVNTQMTYDADSQTTGGALFGDNTLKSIKAQLQNLMLTPVGTGSIKYLSDIGITIGDDNELSLDSSKFEEVLSTNFQDVENLFTDWGYCENSEFQYVYSGTTTQSGTYAVEITQLSGTLAGTIDGLEAVGSSDSLTLKDSTSKAYGLQISYTGTTVPASANFTFFRGIASLIESAVNQFTDSVNGTVTIQETGLQTTIDRLNQKVTDTQANIDQKMEMLKTQFIAMETAVSEMNSMADYLESQLDS